MKNKFDALIVGAGQIGGALANLLLKLNWKVGAIDTQTTVGPGKHDSPIVCAINLQSKDLLNTIGIWNQIPKEFIGEFKNMAVKDATGGGKIEFNGDSLGYPSLGNIVSNRAITHLLRQKFTQNGGKLISPAKIKTVKKLAHDWQITLEDDTILTTKLLIAADGANSFIRSQLKIDLWENSYDQIAFVTTLKTEKPHQNTCRQWFHPHSILAFLPMNDPNYVSIVWSVDKNEAQQQKKLTHEEIAKQLSVLSAFELGKVEVASQIYSRPLKMRHVKSYIDEGFALVGDAAHTIHPLAGQGVNLGFRDVTNLFEILKEAKDKGRDAAAIDTLRKYERSRKGDTWTLIATMEAFKQGFVNNNEWLATIRSLGLDITDKLDLLKKFFTYQACKRF